jgi:hypothetical protein
VWSGHSASDLVATNIFNLLSSTLSSVLDISFSCDEGAAVCTVCAAGSYYGSTGMSATICTCIFEFQRVYLLCTIWIDHECNSVGSFDPCCEDMKFAFLLGWRIMTLERWSPVQARGTPVQSATRLRWHTYRSRGRIFFLRWYLAAGASACIACAAGLYSSSTGMLSF